MPCTSCKHKDRIYIAYAVNLNRSNNWCIHDVQNKWSDLCCCICKKKWLTVKSIYEVPRGSYTCGAEECKVMQQLQAAGEQ